MTENRAATRIEIIEALDKVRTWAKIVVNGMKESPGGDCYVYEGSMDEVEALREAISNAEGLAIVGVTGTSSDHNPDFRKAIDAMFRVLPLIDKAAGDKGQHGRFICPVCLTGNVDWTRSRHNGHRAAKCSTPGCVEFME